MQERDLWKSYQKLHSENPKSDSEAKVAFYSQNSEFIIRNSKNNDPNLAIIIPAFNEHDLIPRTLASINQSLKNNLQAQVFVVDNGSADETAELAQFFGTKVVYEANKGIGQARQTGLEAVPPSVKHILTTDADTVVSFNWISPYQEAFKKENIVGAYGKRNFFADDFLPIKERILLRSYSKIASLTHNVKNSFGAISCGSANFGFVKDIALECGGYDREFQIGEDKKLAEEISKYGEIISVDNFVMTSGRRMINTGIINLGVKRFKRNIQNCFKEDSYGKGEYQDYR